MLRNISRRPSNITANSAIHSTAHFSIYLHTAGHLHATGRVAPASRAAFERQTALSTCHDCIALHMLSNGLGFVTLRVGSRTLCQCRRAMPAPATYAAGKKLSLRPSHRKLSMLQAGQSSSTELRGARFSEKCLCCCTTRQPYEAASHS